MNERQEDAMAEAQLAGMRLVPVTPELRARVLAAAGEAWAAGDETGPDEALRERVLAAALAAVVLLAVRNALGTNRDTIEIVHLLGGTDQQIARLFQRSVGFDAAGGGAIGLALGLVAVLLLGRQFAGLDAGLVSGGALGWLDWLLLALVPVVGVGLAILTARWTVLRALRRML